MFDKWCQTLLLQAIDFKLIGEAFVARLFAKSEIPESICLVVELVANFVVERQRPRGRADAFPKARREPKV